MLKAVIDTSKETQSGRVFEDAVDVVRALKPDTPMFCMCEDQLVRQLTTFQDGFPGLVTYAVKANPSMQVLAILAQHGIDTFDVASPTEMALVREARPDAVLHYNNPVKSRSEITDALNVFGVRNFSIDDEAELEKIADAAEAPSQIEIAVRFRGAKNRAVCDFSSKFGASPLDAARLLQLAASMGFRTALTFHAGSQCLDPLSYAENIEAAASICRNAGVWVDRLNIGGGFPIDFPSQQVPPLSTFFSTIEETTKRCFGGHTPTLIAEPGRAMVASSASLLARVKHRRPQTDEIFINDGVYGALMELNLLPVDLPCRVLTQTGVKTGPLREFVVYGPTCDPNDRIPRPLSLSADIAEGDWIEIGLVGAYGAATVTSFNGYGTVNQVAVRSALTS